MEKINLGISIVAIIISIGNSCIASKKYAKYNEYQEKNLNYNADKDRDNFKIQIKEELNNLRMDLNEIKNNEIEILHEQKDDYTFILNNKYDCTMFEKHTNKNIYNDFLNLNVKVDEALDYVVYQKDYTKIRLATFEIRQFYTRLI